MDIISLKTAVYNLTVRPCKDFAFYLKHLGTRHYCPFCGHHTKDFDTMGQDVPVLSKMQVVGGGVRRCHCYYCDSIDRERLVYYYLCRSREVDLGNTREILHIAPEKNLHRILKKACAGRYICADKFAEGYSYDSDVRQMDITDMDMPDNSVDLLICCHVLEHVPDDMKALSEIHRVLRPGGKAILQVPYSPILDHTVEDKSVTDPAERERLYDQFDHVRLYGMDYKDRLEKAGFNVCPYKPEAPTIEKYGLNPAEVLWVAVK